MAKPIISNHKNTTHPISLAVREVVCPNNIIPMVHQRRFNHLSLHIFIRPDISHRTIDSQLLDNLLKTIIHSAGETRYSKFLLQVETGTWGKITIDPRRELDKLGLPYLYSDRTGIAKIKWNDLQDHYFVPKVVSHSAE